MESLFKGVYHMGGHWVVEGAGCGALTGPVTGALVQAALGKVVPCGMRVGVQGKQALQGLNAPGRNHKGKNWGWRAGVDCKWALKLVQKKRGLWGRGRRRNPSTSPLGTGMALHSIPPPGPAGGATLARRL